MSVGWSEKKANCGSLYGVVSLILSSPYKHTNCHEVIKEWYWNGEPLRVILAIGFNPMAKIQAYPLIFPPLFS